jgi:ATP-dependent RNA helicase RhlE
VPFASLGLGSKLAQALREKGYVEPTPIQAKAIPIILSGRDVIGVAQTGTGKTAAFVLPLLERLSTGQSTRSMRVLVIAPTRELVAQIEENIRAYGRHLRLQYATIFGGVGEGPQIQALKRGVDIVVATPGRLLDLMQQRHVDFSSLQVLVLDEADRMLDMGFLPAIRKIAAATPGSRQTLLFSATMSKEIEAVAKAVLRSPALVEIGARSTPAEAVTQYVVEVSPAGKVPALIHLLTDAALESVLVFSRTKHGADRIARKLGTAGLMTATLHSNRTQGQRLAALKRFRSGEVRVLIATDIAARGIDVDGISHVINFDFPPQPEDYVHRIGRTGRAQAIGDAISFVTHEDADSLRRLERFLGRGIARKKLDGYVPPSQAQAKAPLPASADKRPSHDARAPSQRPPHGASKPKRPRSGAYGPTRLGQRHGRPQGRRGRT